MKTLLKEKRLANHRLVNLFHTLALLGAMMLLLVLIGYLLAGAAGVLWAALLGLVVLFISSNISPLLILRVYRARPFSFREAPDLYENLHDLAARAGLAIMPRLYYVPSSTMNAFAVGSRQRAAIGITDGLLRHLNTRELTGVLAHEMSHIAHNDIKVMGLADVITRLTSLFSTLGQALLLINLPLLLLGEVTISWLAIAILLLAPILNTLLQLALSRTRELDADLGAAYLTGDPQGLASALQKMEYYHRGNWLERILLPGRGIPDPSLLRTHPDTRERIERLMSLVEAVEPKMPLEVPEIFYQPVRVKRITRRPRWRIGGIWY